MNAREQELADLLDQYLDELETNPNVTPPQELGRTAATAQKMRAHLAAEPNPKFAAALRAQIERAAEMQNARAPQPPPRRRTVSAARWSFAGIAAALVVGSIALAFWATRPPSVNAEELLTNARSAARDLNKVNVKSFAMIQETYDARADDPNAPPTRATRGEIKTWYAGPTRWRIESQQAATNQPLYKTIQVADGDAQYDFDVNNNTVNVQVAESKSFPSPSAASLDFLRQDFSNCYEPNVVGEETIAGRAAYKVDMGIAKCRSAAAPALNGPHTIWLDKKTFFVLKSEIRALTGDAVTSSMAVTAIDYNQALPNDLFTFTPPADAKINDMRPKPAPSAQEYQTQLSALAARVEFPLFAPAELPNGLVPRAPQWNEIEKQIELAYVPAAQADTNSLAQQDGVSILEKRADYETLRGWSDGAEPFALDGAQGWIRRGDFDPSVGTGSNSAATVLRDGTLLLISSFRVKPDALIELAKTLQTVPGSHAPAPNPTAPTLQALRAQADYPILIPTYVPDDLTPAPPMQNEIDYYRADGTKALMVQNAKQGAGAMEQESRFQGELVELPNGRVAHQLLFNADANQPTIVILWWVQDGGYTALESHGIARDETLKIAASMSSAAELGKTHAPPVQPTPTAAPAPAFQILRPTWLPEKMTVVERNIPTPDGKGAGIEIHFDPHPDSAPHDTLTLTEMPKAFAESFNDPQFQKKDIGGRDVTFNKIGSGCVMYSWVQGDVALRLTNAYDPPGEPGQVRYTCEQMEKIIALIP